MWSRIFVFLLMSAAAVGLANAASPKIDNDFVHQQFGDSCDLEAQWQPLTGDLNGDGVEDLVFVARCKNPLIDQDDKNYKVIDPMDSFYGYGNTKVTTGFGQNDPRMHGICILVIHGEGSDAWRSTTTQAKFVIINLAVKTITVKKMRINKKRSTTAIYVEEATGDQMTSAIFWDGKKYRYEPLGSSME
jgi:hypothetical protein